MTTAAQITFLQEEFCVDPSQLKEDIASSLIQRSFCSSRFLIDAEGGDFRLLLHSNHIVLFSLAPSHPILLENLNVTSIEYSTKHLATKIVTGKNKHGAQYLIDDSILAIIYCDNGKSFKVRPGIACKLLEINEKLKDEGNLIKNLELGYIALLDPKRKDFEKEINKLMTTNQYLASLKERNIVLDEEELNKAIIGEEKESRTKELQSELKCLELTKIVIL